MGKIFKISGFLIAPGNDHTVDDIQKTIENGIVIPRHLHIEDGGEILGEWSNSPLKDPNCDLAICEKYFRSKPSSDTGRTVEPGAFYRHFKGKLVRVMTVSQDTESPGSWSVVYMCMDGDNVGKVWHRPYDMFLSEVDYEKYPDVTQKYRFEKVEVLE